MINVRFAATRTMADVPNKQFIQYVINWAVEMKMAFL